MRVLSLVLCLIDIYHESIIVVGVLFTGYIPSENYRCCIVYWTYTMIVLSLAYCLLNIYHEGIIVGVVFTEHIP